MKSVLVVALTACTTLGPVPATTGVSAVPAGAPGVEAQVGLMPGYFLSRGAQDKSGGAIMGQLSALVDPDRWLPIPGLILGARLFGQDQDTPGEPMIGYRRALDDSLSIGVVGYATSKRSTRQLASYHAAQGGAEAAIDTKLARAGSWFELHTQLAVAATYTSASGTYCVNGSGIAVDCDTEHPQNNTMIDGKLSGVFEAATATLGLDFLRSPGHANFHGARVAAMMAAGTMPLVANGMQEATDFYWSIGASLALGFGAER